MFFGGVAVACSSLEPLIERSGDAALFFDPEDTRAIADTIMRLWADPALRATLVCRGTTRVAHLTRERVARVFSAHYRRFLGPCTERRRQGARFKKLCNERSRSVISMVGLAGGRHEIKGNQGSEERFGPTAEIL